MCSENIMWMGTCNLEIDNCVTKKSRTEIYIDQVHLFEIAQYGVGSRRHVFENYTNSIDYW